MRKFHGMLVVCLLLCLCLTVPVAHAQDASYQAGYAFGAEYGSSVEGNIASLKSAARQAGVAWSEMVAVAEASALVAERALPDKVAYLRGMAAGANLPLSDLYAFNFSDKLAGALYGECTTHMAQGSAMEGGGTVITKNRDQSINTLSEVAIEEAARHAEGDAYKAAYIDIPQPSETYRFVGSRTAGRWGYGMGVNEWGVTVSDNDANSRDELQFEAGLHDNDVIRLVLERAKTAREGVDVVAALVEEYGQAWNGIMFEIGDKDELWIVEVTGKRWAAKKYTDDVTARSNQFQLEDDYDLCSSDLVSFAEATWGVKANAEGKINFRQAYGTLELYPEDNEGIADRPSAEKLYNTEMRYQRGMEMLNQKTANGGQVTLKDMAEMARDHYDTYTLPSGKVVEMNQVPFYSSDLVDWYGREWYDVYPEGDTIETSIYIRGACSHDLGWGATSTTGILIAQEGVPATMLHSYMPPCLGTFVPFFALQDEVDARYETPDAAVQHNAIVTRSFGFHTLYFDSVRAAFDPYENAMFDALAGINHSYADLMKGGKTREAALLLTVFSADQANSAYTAAAQALSNMTIAAIEASAW